MNRPSMQKFNKETAELNDNVDEMNLTDIYRMFNSQPLNTQSVELP
jgi:hypothetical protein